MPIFNSPPGWPVPPAGWTPPDDWKPDPSWPPAPDGWQWWIDDAPPAPVPATAPAPAPAPAPPAGLPPHPPVAAQSAAPSGIFGKKKHLEAENAELRQWVTYLQGLEPMQHVALADNLRSELSTLQQQLAGANAQLAQVRASIVQTEEIALLQEAGIYEYQHPLADAVAYKARLDQLRAQIKAMAKNNGAVLAATNWQVNGSEAEGRKMVRDFSKLMLRAYNAEADNCVQSVRPHRLQATVDRLSKVRDTIAKLGKTMSIRISDQYHFTRVDEIQLAADYRAKLEAEKEENRADGSACARRPPRSVSSNARRPACSRNNPTTSPLWPSCSRTVRTRPSWRPSWPNSAPSSPPSWLEKRTSGPATCTSSPMSGRSARRS